MTQDEYIKLKARETDLVYCHCRNCLGEKPKYVSGADWSALEAIIDLTTGFMTLGCGRCKLPIVQTVVDPHVIAALSGKPCELCDKKETKH